MTDDELKNQFSPRLSENWDKFKSWATDQNFIPEEIFSASSFQEAVKTINKLSESNKNDKEYSENLYELLLAVEQLYINMCTIDKKMRMVTRKL